MIDNFVKPSVVENAVSPGIAARGTGPVIKVSINDDAINEVIAAGFNRLMLERSTDGGLTWAERTLPDERPVLERNKTAYSVTDRAGDSSYLYRTRYYATQGAIQGQRSDASEHIEGAGLAIASILTVAELKARYLFGVDITDDAGNAFTDAAFTHYILAAIRHVEHELDISLLPTAFTEKHDYHREEYQAFAFLQLDNSPVISVDEFRVQYPSGQNVIIFPTEWVRLNKERGQVQIVPTAGTLSTMAIGANGSFLPAIYSGMPYLPQLFEISYTAGFESGRVPRNIVDVVGMLASMGPFNVFGDLIAGAGIATLSLGMDGLSQSIGTTSSATNAGYGARIIQYTKQAKAQLTMLKQYYRGIRMAVA